MKRAGVWAHSNDNPKFTWGLACEGDQEDIRRISESEKAKLLSEKPAAEQAAKRSFWAKSLRNLFYIRPDSSVGRAEDWKSSCHWFDSGSGHERKTSIFEMLVFLLYSLFFILVIEKKSLVLCKCVFHKQVLERRRYLTRRSRVYVPLRVWGSESVPAVKYTFA